MTKTYQDVQDVTEIALFLNEEYPGMKVQATVFLDTLITGSIASRYYLTNKIAAHDFHFEEHQPILDFITTHWTDFTRLILYYEDNENHLKLATQADAFTITVSAAEILSLSTPSDAIIILTSQQAVTDYYEVKENAAGNYEYDFFDQFANAKTFANTHYADLISGLFSYNLKSPLFAWDNAENLYFTP